MFDATVAETEESLWGNVEVIGGKKVKTRKISVNDKQVNAEVIYYDYQPDLYELVCNNEYVLRRVRDPEVRYNYAPTGGVTVCVVRVEELGIGGIGVAVCSDSDRYSRRVGRPVSFKRALESLLETGRFDVAAPYVQQCSRRVAISNIVTNIHTFYTTPAK